MLDFNDIFRLITATLLCWAWYVISVSTAQRWPSMTRRGRRLWLAYYAILFANVWGTVEGLKLDYPITSRNYVFLLATIALLVAGLLKLEGDESTDRVYRIQREGNPLKWRIIKLR